MLFLVPPSLPHHGLPAAVLTTNGISCRDVPAVVTPVTRRCHIAQSREVCAPRSQGVIQMTHALRESAFLALCRKDAESRSLETLRELLDEKFVPPQRSDSIVVSCLDVLLGRFDFVVIREISLLL